MLTQERLKELLILDEDTGIFTRRTTIGKGGFGCQEGDTCGGLSTNGYIRISVNNKYYPRSHLVWLYITGSLPTKTIDHINRNRQDDRPTNLREVDNIDNYKNMKLFNTNKSGHVGVSWHKKGQKWMAVIMVNYKQQYLGLFNSIQEAVNAREQASIFYGFDTTHGKKPFIN